MPTIFTRLPAKNPQTGNLYDVWVNKNFVTRITSYGEAECRVHFAKDDPLIVSDTAQNIAATLNWPSSLQS